jgi:hypothetical protein
VSPVSAFLVLQIVTQPLGSSNPWWQALPAWLSAGAAVLTLGLAIISARWAAKQWRLQHFTTEWGKTVAFLQANPKYINRARNLNYRRVYAEGEERDTYELVARYSIGYVDDLFHLGMGKYLRSWMVGSVHLFVMPHQAWFQDHEGAYSTKFVAEMKRFLPQLPSVK